MVPSRGWFIGFLTLLHSVHEHTITDDEQCSYVFLVHPELPDSNFNSTERKLIQAATRPRHVVWHTVNSHRLQLWRTVPNLRSGALMAIIKLELFFDRGPCTWIFLDIDTLVLRPLGFMHALLREDAHNADTARRGRTSEAWVLHGSSNWYGLAGWLFTAETTSIFAININTGMLAFRTPAPLPFLQAMEARVAQRVREDLHIYLADQDIINHALAHQAAARRHIHYDWYANYRPKDEATLASWRLVHWMGVMKPWGKTGHTTAPVRYNDRVIYRLDAMWSATCTSALGNITGEVEAVARLLPLCSPHLTRLVPGPVPREAAYLGVAALWLLLLAYHTVGPCGKRLGRRCTWLIWLVILAQWLGAVYVFALFDHLPRTRHFLGVVDEKEK